jgi:predicted DNA-binding protein (MmcQ/YjbR family)
MGVTESFPFDNETIVFKVGNKMFALADIEEFNSFNVKCDPDRAIDIRERFQAVRPGYHMNKKHWNTVSVNMDLNDKELQEQVIHSYELILNSLPKKKQHEIKGR